MDRLTDEQKELYITLLFGWCGAHKYLKGDIKGGLVYTFTIGLFMIGWIIDVIKCFTKSKSRTSLLGKNGLEAINNGVLPTITNTNLNLANDEECHYMDSAYSTTEKTITTGYSGKHGGVSVRLAKGLSYHTGGSGSKAIRETFTTTYNGILYITNKRVIYTSQKDSFDKTFDKITSINEFDNGIIIQIGSNTYKIYTNTHKEFIKVFNMVK